MLRIPMVRKSIFRFVKKLGRSRRSRRHRVSHFEHLEARRVLAAAIWNNVGQAVNVDGDMGGFVSAIDALLVINELNQREFSSRFDGRLPKQTAEPVSGRFFDVNCDNFVSPLDALLVINHLNNNGPNGGPSQGGVFPGVACSPQLLESTQFATELSQVLTLPDSSSAVKVHFQAPQFDFTSRASIRDAFEIEITDTAGNSVAFPYLPNRDAVYNWSEDLEPLWGAGTATITQPAGLDSSATINLSGLPSGSQVRVTARLVNNDADNTTSVIVRGFEVIAAIEARPSGVPGTAGRLAAVDPVDRSQLDDISGSFAPSYGRTTLKGDNNELMTELVVTNRGNQAVTGRIIVAIDNISELDANAMHPDGFTPDGSPYFDLTAEMNGQPLEPGASLRSREIAFLNNSGNRFTYKLRTLGALNAAPTGFTTQPLASIEAGKIYRYAAQAQDPDGQALTYSLVSGPQALQIDAQSGKLTWVTVVADIGSHHVTLRATDPHGLFIEQSFSIGVIESQQNRPPNFVTDPVTDAIASSGFEITTVATGAGPAGVSVISGFRGSRLVSINGGDQTLSVLVGQNNDRFDDATQYFTGEPRPTDSLFDVGYSVDIGLPAWTQLYDGRFVGNEVAGMDHADLNGDGFLDLVALTTFMASSLPQTMQITRMLNDGNGNFGAPQVIGALLNPDQVKNLVIADINGDGHQDVLALQRRTSKIFTIVGNGDGTFQSMVTTTLDVNFDDFRVVDLDQDGKLDLVGRRGQVGFGINYDLVWKPGAGDGTFLVVQEIAPNGGLPGAFTDLNARPYDVIDADGDGDQDIVTANNFNGNIDVLLNDGSQRFTLGVSIDPPGGNNAPYALHVADFTGDGKLDIAVNNSLSPRIDLFVGDGSGIGFTHREGGVIYGSSGNWAGSDEPRDIDGDGDLDLVLTNAWTGDPLSPQVLINDGSGFFARFDYPMIDFPGQVAEGNQVSGDVVRSAMFGDYNADGVIDLAYATTGTDFNGLGIRLGTRPGEFGSTRTTPLPGGGTGSEIHAGDFNRDGLQDLLALPSNLILLGDGRGGFQASFPAYQVSQPGTFGSIADFNRDGLPDVVATAGGSRYYVALANGDGTFIVSDDKFVGAGYSATRIGDFNNDGLPDFIAKAAGERHIDVHLNLASQPGTFARSFRTTISGQGINVSGFDQAFAVGDFNQDGNLDFVAGDQVSGEPLKLVTYAGDGAGNFSVIAENFAYDDALFSGLYPGDFGVGDLNGDGIDDLVSFTHAGPRIHLGNGDGTFTTTDHYPVDPILQRGLDSYVIDFNEDGRLDLVQLTPFSNGGGGSGTLSVRLGRGDGTFDDGLRVGLQGGASPATFADMDNTDIWIWPTR